MTPARTKKRSQRSSAQNLSWINALQWHGFSIRVFAFGNSRHRLKTRATKKLEPELANDRLDRLSAVGQPRDLIRVHRHHQRLLNAPAVDDAGNGEADIADAAVVLQ